MATIEGLIERGEELGCVNLSELTELAQELELPDDELQALHERLEARATRCSSSCATCDAIRC
jgi:hypothetical protein